MRLLLAIPHYFDPNGGGRHGALRDRPLQRLSALATCLTSLHQLFGPAQRGLDIAGRTTFPTNQSATGTVDIVVCTTGEKHLLGRLALTPGHFTHHPTDADRKLLGFECHAVLRDRLPDGYDYYCYLEDDLVLHDPLFFVKLRWFADRFGGDALLMPNRYEVGHNRPVAKAYIDGPIRPGATAEFQDVTETPELEADVLGARTVFRRSTNPHSGAFFLTAAQMAAWAAKPYFLDRDVRFVGPLESAATLGVTRTFRVYKPAPENAAFLEVRHSGTAFLSRIVTRPRPEPKPEPPPTAPSAPAVVRSDTAFHIVFVHQNYPAQFGHLAAALARLPHHRCTFVSRKPADTSGPVERVQYHVRGGATRHNHPCTRSFENAVHHSLGVYAALRDRPDIKPDLVVGHSGFGSTVYLRDLYPDTPVVNYFEWFYHTTGGDLDFRPEFPSSELGRLRARTRNAMILLDLEACAAGYSPTSWQWSRLPPEFQSKVQVIHDGIDTGFWKPADTPTGPHHARHLVYGTQPGDWTVPAGTKLVTYVSRGFESMRGFDVFMRVAQRVCRERSDVVFAVVGEDRVCYGGDRRFTGGKSFKEWVLSNGEYDLSRIKFLGRLPPRELSRLLAASDLHMYLTVPFVLSWSLLNAMACGAPVLASDTPPVREVVRNGETGLLAGFHDVDRWVRLANEVLDDPAAFRPLGRAARELVREKYGAAACVPRLAKLFRTAAGKSGKPRAANRAVPAVA